MFTRVRDHLHEQTDQTQQLADQAEETKIKADQPTAYWTKMGDVTSSRVMPILAQWRTQLKAQPRAVDRQPLQDIRLQFAQLARDPMIIETEQTLVKLEARYRLLQMRRGTRGFLRWAGGQIASGARALWHTIRQRLP